MRRSEERLHELQRKADRANRFREFFETEGLDEYFDTARSQMIETMLKTATSDDVGRFRLQTAIKTLDGFRGFLTSIVRDGELARKELEELRSGRRSFF